MTRLSPALMVLVMFLAPASVAQTSTDDAIETIDGGIEEIRSTAVKLWSFEITRSENQPVTLGKVVIALVTFALCVLFARLFAKWLGSRVLARVGVDEGASHAYQSLAYYVLLAIAFLIALRAVSIPLTAFAVVGGALAIGVGFGSQNIVNNFISGVILLAERPIKRGDLVQVDQTYGNVERIGLRSTRVRTGENIHVIVPNSTFLETNVTNWTHSDSQVRLKISVGVAYGSPTREVERLVFQALEEHEKVLENPEPVVLFMEFGSDSLEFDALFWVQMRRMIDRMKVESDLRFRIDELFREAGITIAFPQRDVHLDASAPIPVRVVDRNENR